MHVELGKDSVCIHMNKHELLTLGESMVELGKRLVPDADNPDVELAVLQLDGSDEQLVRVHLAYTEGALMQ